MIDITESLTKEDAKTPVFEDLCIYIPFKRKRRQKGLYWDCFGINKCFYSVFKREKGCTFGVVCATKKNT